MGTSASEIIALAQNTKALSKEQLARILAVAPTMTAGDLEKLKATIVSIQESEMAKMKKDLEIHQKVNAHYFDWKADKSRDALQTQEGAVQSEDTAQAEALIQNI